LTASKLLPEQLRLLRNKFDYLSTELDYTKNAAYETLAKQFGISPSTVRYHIDSNFYEYQQRRNKSRPDQKSNLKRAVEYSKFYRKLEDHLVGAFHESPRVLSLSQIEQFLYEKSGFHLSPRTIVKHADSARWHQGEPMFRRVANDPPAYTLNQYVAKNSSLEGKAKKRSKAK